MATTNWKLDPAHSQVQFKTTYLMINKVTGIFTDVEGTFTTDDNDFAKATIDFKANTNSLTTHNENRDKHLKSELFFDVEKYPTMTFKSSHNEKLGEALSVVGDLTIKGITKSLLLSVKFGGIIEDPWGCTKAGFSISGDINKNDFGLTWNLPIESGGMLVGDTVELTMEIQLIKQK